MKTLIIIVPILSFIAGAIFHERDIQRNCEDFGEAKSSAWLGNFECVPKPTKGLITQFNERHQRSADMPKGEGK
jgi:hypothetical protein